MSGQGRDKVIPVAVRKLLKPMLGSKKKSAVHSKSGVFSTPKHHGPLDPSYDVLSVRAVILIWSILLHLFKLCFPVECDWNVKVDSYNTTLYPWHHKSIKYFLFLFIVYHTSPLLAFKLVCMGKIIRFVPFTLGLVPPSCGCGLECRGWNQMMYRILWWQGIERILRWSGILWILQWC